MKVARPRKNGQVSQISHKVEQNAQSKSWKHTVDEAVPGHLNLGGNDW